MARRAGAAAAGSLPDRVKVLIDSWTAPSITEDEVMEALLRRHREYQRKNKTALRASVVKVLKGIQAAQESGAAQDEAASAPPSPYAGHALDRAVEPATVPKGAMNMLNRTVTRAYAAPRAEAGERDGAASGTEGSQAGESGKAKRKRKRQESRAARKQGDETEPPPEKLGASFRGARVPGGPLADESRSWVVPRPAARFSDLAGIDHLLQDVRELIEYPLTHPEIFIHLGVDPPRGVLLHGPPGCGKSLLSDAVAGELGVTYMRISAPEIVSGMSGESEEKLRALFEEAVEKAPTLVFLDEIDAITPKRETSQRGMERRMVAQLLTCMDGLGGEDARGRGVVVVAATNRPDALDSALRRAGRFDRELCLTIPDEAARRAILAALAGKMRLSGGVDFAALAKRTPGFVGADLAALTKEAAVLAVNRIFREIGVPVSAQAFAGAARGMEEEEEEEEDGEATGGGGEGGENGVGGGQTEGGGTQEAEAGQEEGGGVGAVTAGVARVRVAAPGDAGLSSVEARAAASDHLRGRAQLTEEELAPLAVGMQDFDAAVGKVQPSAKREGFATVPDVTWEQVGALHEVRRELALAVMEPIRCPERFQALGLSMPAGVMLYGPPGCGKTLLAKAIANESGANFISIKGPELLDKYVGETERAVRQTFQRAQASHPCVVFFDELDALAPKRGESGSGNGVTERVVNQLLTELDGMEGRQQVFVIAATNRPDMIDPAMLRPGRLDKLLYVPLPSASDRTTILHTLTRKMPLAADVELKRVAEDARCEGLSGADLSALVREAGVSALRQSLEEDAGSVLSRVIGQEARTPRPAREPGSGAQSDGAALCVSARDFEFAFGKVTASVSPSERVLYERLRKRVGDCSGDGNSS